MEANKIYEIPQQVAVYGTLRKNGHNHEVLSRAKSTYLGDFWTQRRYAMFDYGGFPAVVLDGNDSILLEVYRVENLAPIDELEGWPQLYARKLVPTPYGKAWLYWMDRHEIDILCPKVGSGNWITYEFKRSYI